jgi:inosine/xanthosine triphosphatase
MHIFVGSTNPVKVNAVVTAASETWPDVMVRGVDVVSGVSHQPRTDDETRQGAQNRAHAALAAGRELLERNELFAQEQLLGIGLEGGVFERTEGELWSTVWVVVVDVQGKITESNGARFKIPLSIAEPILLGEEMGPVMDRLLQANNTKQAGGAIGIITRNFVDRTEEYSGIAKMALGLWYGRDWEALIR